MGWGGVVGMCKLVFLDRNLRTNLLSVSNISVNDAASRRAAVLFLSLSD